MSKRTLIKDFQGNQFIEGVFAIQNCQLGQTRNGKPFLKCLIADRSARVPGRMWNTTEELFRGLPTDGFVWLEGQTQPYQGEMQIIIQTIYGVEPKPEDLKDLLPCTQYDVEEMFAEVTRVLQSLGNEHLKTLAQAYLADEALMSKFKNAPAAMTLHHAYLGGLLEHTLQLLRLAQTIMPLYPTVNKDVVTMGLFLHDLGKCQELTWETGFGYSDDGQLIGHVARGVIWLEQKAKELADKGTPVPQAIVRVLGHIILSHHGQPDFGALKIPSTPEAVAVSLIDNLDAKLHMANVAAARERIGSENDLGGNFTEKVWALDTRIYRPDPTTVSDEPRG